MTRSRCSSRSTPRREPLRSRLPLVQTTKARTSTPLNARLHADARQPKYRTAAPPAALHWAVLMSTACSRASDGQVRRWRALVTSQTRERSGSHLRAVQVAVFARSSWRRRDRVRFSASSLVTFFWQDRRKLPRRRAGLPAMHRARARSARATNKKRGRSPVSHSAAQAAHHCSFSV